MFDLNAVQAALQQLGFDGWLLYDFRGLNVLARRIVGMTGSHFLSRRWFYFVPAHGTPLKLVHRIEPGSLDHLPGERASGFEKGYLRWQELEAGVQALVQGRRRVAMEYVPRNANPYVSRVDAGTIELVQSFGVEVVPSGDLIQLFEAAWDDEQYSMHLEAAKHTSSAYDSAFAFITERVKRNQKVTECDVQEHITQHFAKHGLVADHPAICAVNANAANPHFAPSRDADTPINKGDFILIDLWGKLDRPRAVYSDLTWTCFVGPSVPEKYSKVFSIVAAARDAAINRVRQAFADREVLQGWQVDDAARNVIEQAGYGEFFCHRTGHSIGEEVHGNGANMDNLETHEERRVLPRTCFSVEPGIYLPGDFGIRSEVDVFVDAKGGVHVTGPEPQKAIVPLLG